MPCPLYQGLISGNPLKVCGPEGRIGYVPSLAHLKVFCLSISAYAECPMYKLKTSNWQKMNRWFRFFRQIFGLFTR
jgi:hypothetical protein